MLCDSSKSCLTDFEPEITYLKISTKEIMKQNAFSLIVQHIKNPHESESHLGLTTKELHQKFRDLNLLTRKFTFNNRELSNSLRFDKQNRFHSIKIGYKTVWGVNL